MRDCSLCYKPSRHKSCGFPDYGSGLEMRKMNESCCDTGEGQARAGTAVATLVPGDAGAALSSLHFPYSHLSNLLSPAAQEIIAFYRFPHALWGREGDVTQE